MMLTVSGGCTSADAASAPPARSRVLAAAPQPQEAGADSPEAEHFAPLPVPQGFDAGKARLVLSEIPDDPPAPPSAAADEPQDANAQVLRRLEVARRLFEEHRYTETIGRLDEVLRHQPDNHAAHRLRALASLLSGNEVQARSSAERALALRPDDLASHYVMGRFADRAGQSDEAIQRYRTALKCTPGEFDQTYLLLTHYYLGLLLESRGYYAAAADQLEQFQRGLMAMGDDELMDNPELLTISRIHLGAVAVRMSRAYGLLGEYAAAADALRRVCEQLPGDSELRVEYIRMLGRAGRMDEAAAEASRLVAEARSDRTPASSDLGEAVELLLAVHQAAGHPERGVEAIDAIIAEQPDNLELRLIQIDALIAAQRNDDAARALEALIERDESAVEARWKLVELHRARKDWQAWRAALAGQLVAHPDEYARAERELERLPLSAARAMADEHVGASELDDSDPAAGAAQDYLMARICHRLGRLDDALRLFGHALERDPGFIPAAGGVAETYVQQCQWQQALEVLEAAAAGQASSRIERLLGRCHEALDNTEQAIAHYQKAVEIDRGDSEAMLLLGGLYQRNNRFDDARRQYQAAVAADENNMLAREALIRSLLTSGPRTAGQEEQARSRLLAELIEMQRIDSEDHAALRCGALLKFIFGDQEWEPYLEALQELVRAGPDDVRTREDLARALYEIGDFAGAQTHVREILSRDPCHVSGHELSAALAVRTLAMDDAAGQYERMLALYPNREPWMRQFAELRLAEQNYDAAIAQWSQLLDREEVRDSPERRIAYRFSMMLAIHEARRFDEGHRLIESWMQEEDLGDGMRHAYRSLLLALDAGAGDYEKYMERCRQWLSDAEAPAEEDGQPVADGLIALRRQLLLGMLTAHRRGEAELAGEAVALALAWLSESPEDHQSVEHLVEALVAAGQWEGAAELARSHAAVADDPRMRATRLWALLPDVYRRVDRHSQSIEVLLEVLEEDISPALANVARRQLVGDLAQAGQFDRAQAQIEAMLADTEDESAQAYLLRHLAFIYQRQDRHEVAEQRLREAYDLASSDPGINNDFGYTLADAGKNLEEARQMIELALSGSLGQKQRVAAYLDSYGWVLYKLGEFEEARTWLGRSAAVVAPTVDDYIRRVLGDPALDFMGRADPTAKADGEDPVIFDHLGDAHWRLGEADEAVAAWKRALRFHEFQLRTGDAGMEKDLAERVQAKLKAVATGQEPEIAPLGEGIEPVR